MFQLHPAVPSLWRVRWNDLVAGLVHLLWVLVLYLASELIVWGLSRSLHPAGLDFFASILGMVLIFSLSTAAYFVWRGTDHVYRHWIKAKVDFINAHLGLGFPVPIIMLHQNEALGGRDIACIIGTFVTTNLISWISVFVLSAATLSGASRLMPTCFANNQLSPPPSSILSSQTLVSTETRLSRNALKTRILGDHHPQTSDSEHSSQETLCGATTPARQVIVWRFIEAHFPILLSLSGIFIIGVPVAAAAHDERFVDGFTMWFIWISSVTAQRSFKASQIMSSKKCLKRSLTATINPVLMTVFVMMAYTRLKALAFGRDGLAQVLKTFSSGTPLYALWMAAASGKQVGQFGAGDAALSLLECGILTWGFKLSECRRQIFSPAGLMTIILCTAAAAGNVFLSVLMGRWMGLAPPEALSFAARSTTLALAKPAVEAIGGNVVVNATLVVGNGVLGQLMYPLILGRLGVTREPRSSSQEDADDGGSDGPVTIATGIAIGINGAAMGVSYLYEARSRAAPYAALAMTVFGVMTVVFTTVGPFRGVVVGLACR